MIIFWFVRIRAFLYFISIKYENQRSSNRFLDGYEGQFLFLFMPPLKHTSISTTSRWYNANTKVIFLDKTFFIRILTCPFFLLKWKTIIIIIKLRLELIGCIEIKFEFIKTVTWNEIVKNEIISQFGIDEELKSK